MSKYFEVLERLEGGKIDKLISRIVDTKGPADRARTDVAAAPRAAEPVATPRLATVRGSAARGPAAAAKRDVVEQESEAIVRQPVSLPARATAPLQGTETLFHNIEALTKGKRPLTLVFAGASANDAVQAVTQSLIEYAERKGERAVMAELLGSGVRGTVVRPCAREAKGGCDVTDGVQIDLHGGADRETLARLREQMSPGAEILLVVGPSLVDSVNSALLASLCDGLVMVAVREDTHRDALTVAAERVRLTKAPSIGIVVDTGRSKTPPWLRRLIER